MKPKNPNQPSTGQDGYSMVELLVVLGIIAIMAAVSIPNIAGYVRNYRIRGAAQQIAGELQTARNKAITTNTNQGVSFRIMDLDSYRILITAETGNTLGPLRQLPPGVIFAAAATTPADGMAFDRLGRVCAFGPTCVAAASPTLGVMCPGTDLSQCTNRVPGTYVDTTGGTMTVTLREEATQALRTITVAPGGRVVTQR